MIAIRRRVGADDDLQNGGNSELEGETGAGYCGLVLAWISWALLCVLFNLNPFCVVSLPMPGASQTDSAVSVSEALLEEMRQLFNLTLQESSSWTDTTELPVRVMGRLSHLQETIEGAPVARAAAVKAGAVTVLRAVLQQQKAHAEVVRAVARALATLLTRSPSAVVAFSADAALPALVVGVLAQHPNADRTNGAVAGYWRPADSIRFHTVRALRGAVRRAANVDALVNADIVGALASSHALSSASAVSTVEAMAALAAICAKHARLPGAAGAQAFHMAVECLAHASGSAAAARQHHRLACLASEVLACVLAAGVVPVDATSGTAPGADGAAVSLAALLSSALLDRRVGQSEALLTGALALALYLPPQRVQLAASGLLVTAANLATGRTQAQLSGVALLRCAQLGVVLAPDVSELSQRGSVAVLLSLVLRRLRTHTLTVCVSVLQLSECVHEALHAVPAAAQVAGAIPAGEPAAELRSELTRLLEELQRGPTCCHEEWARDMRNSVRVAAVGLARSALGAVQPGRSQGDGATAAAFSHANPLQQQQQP